MCSRYSALLPLALPSGRASTSASGAESRGGGVLDIFLGGEVRHGPSYPDPV